MSQKTTGLYQLIGFPRIYATVQRMLGGADARRRMVDTLMQPPTAGRILDLGCGAGDILHVLPPACDYIGIDANPRHIEAARSTHGSRGRFVCGDFTVAPTLREGGEDLVIMLGLIHHLDDAAAVAALRLAYDLLAPDGRLFAIDPCRSPNQHLIARFLINRDSGQAVRDEPGYRRLAEAALPNFETVVRHDLIRVPYTHCILTCRRDERHP